jgi:hypothetical protein
MLYSRSSRSGKARIQIIGRSYSWMVLLAFWGDWSDKPCAPHSLPCLKEPNEFHGGGCIRRFGLAMHACQFAALMRVGRGVLRDFLMLMVRVHNHARRIVLLKILV